MSTPLDETEYLKALSRLDGIFGSGRGTPEGDEAETLISLIEAYEDEFCPILPPSVVEARIFREEQEREHI